MKQKIYTLLIACVLMLTAQTVVAQEQETDSVEETVLAETVDEEGNIVDEGIHYQLKTKFVEGSVGFMSLVALALVLGLALCIERIIYLTMSEINNKKLLSQIEEKIESHDVEGAKTLCRDTRGPVASICYQGLMRAQESNLQRGCSWIKLFIAMAPSLGFLGTVIGMVIAFDRIQEAGDISPTIVAEGMKVALITTIFGIIVALILQIFYNYILSKIDHLISQMEDSTICLVDILVKAHRNHQI